MKHSWQFIKENLFKLQKIVFFKWEKTTLGQVTLVLNKFKNISLLQNKLWLPEAPFVTDKSHSGEAHIK